MEVGFGAVSNMATLFLDIPNLNGLENSYCNSKHLLSQMNFRVSKK